MTKKLKVTKLADKRPPFMYSLAKNKTLLIEKNAIMMTWQKKINSRNQDYLPLSVGIMSCENCWPFEQATDFDAIST